MPQLVKLQEELKDSGFVIIATHVQNASKEEVINLCRSNKVNYTVTSGGSVPGDTGNTIPRAFLFDSSGKLVEKGQPSELKAKLHELVKTEPHFLAAGRKYKKLQAVADSLKKSKSYGQILKKLEKDLKGGGDAAEEAKYLAERIRKHGESRLAKAKALERDDAFQAQQDYAEVSTLWKGDEVATKAADRLKELKADKEFQMELRASTMARQILAECDKLVAVKGKIDPEFSGNAKTAASVKVMVAALKKKYPDSRAALTIQTKLEPFGFKRL